jgi:glycerol-3-phosphate dehydrogenase (NAD(P)+)
LIELTGEATAMVIKRVAILGAGGMGTALALLFDGRGKATQLWSRSPERAAAMARSRLNERHLPGVALPDSITITPNACDATAAADLIVVAIPSSFLRATLTDLADRLPKGVPVLSVVKGIENGSFSRPSQIVVELLGDRSVSVLSGPSHAEEIARGLPASVVVGGEDSSLNSAVSDALNHATFRVYTNPDAIGVELAGALKNILGLAAGICDGLGFGDNAKAALLTRGLVEMARFGVALGGREETFRGLAGVGDVITTCFSRFGRNRSVGERIGRGESLEQIIADMVNVAEGVPTTRSVHELSIKLDIPMPITHEVFAILFEGKPPRAAVSDLMLRDPKGEW